jgi:hypothetical protein
VKNGKIEPINVRMAKFLRGLGCTTIISKGEKSVTQNADWKEREGDIFAWKQDAI